MSGPLRTTYDGMPDPKVVIAVGTDAVSGGLLRDSDQTTGGVGATVPVDIWLAGSPPSPFGILNALLIAVGYLTPDGKRSPREPKGRGVAWTEERSDEGRRRLKAPRRRAGETQ
jgi:Ni,Fe-hydrogenase III small subunit